MSKEIAQEIQNITAKIEQSPTAEYYYLRGKLYWKIGDKRLAISDFNKAVQSDPNSPAAIYLKMTGDVMDFYNTDLYNP